MERLDEEVNDDNDGEDDDSSDTTGSMMDMEEHADPDTLAHIATEEKEGEEAVAAEATARTNSTTIHGNHSWINLHPPSYLQILANNPLNWKR
jgi:hypothetical protein